MARRRAFRAENYNVGVIRNDLFLLVNSSRRSTPRFFGSSLLPVSWGTDGGGDGGGAAKGLG
jgi:hypothetical protein